MLKLIPFRAEHLMMFIDRDGLEHTLRAGIEKEKSPSFTALKGDQILGCAGVIIQWQGMGTALVVFSKEAKNIRCILRDIKRSHVLHRIELTVLDAHDAYELWAIKLGFEYESGARQVVRSYTPNKDNVIRMEMVT